MVEKCLGPSELHLKKELSALLKARSLRDPSTCSSWRSPIGSPSIALAYRLSSGFVGKDNQAELNDSNQKVEVSPRNTNNRKKKAHLCNWTYHSRSETGGKGDDRELEFVEECAEECFSKASNVDSRSDTCLEVSANAYTTRGSNRKSLVRKTIRKSRRAVSSRKHVIRHSPGSKLLGFPSSSFGVVRSRELSDDTEHYDLEGLRQSKNELISKADISHTSSPYFTGSGCGNWKCSSKLFRSLRKEDSSHSYTPASTSSYNIYVGKNSSTIASWDGISNDGEDFEQMDLTRTQGCGIPCYWPKRTKDIGCGGWCSPSLSDTLRIKGSRILRGGQKFYRKKNSSVSPKYKSLQKSTQGLPLLTNGCDGGGSSSDLGSDEFSTNYDEIDLEALSRLDGRRWSGCKSQEGLELVQLGEADDLPNRNRCLSQKYRPRSFVEIIGQNTVVQSLRNAILKGRIAPAFLFQGPHGTGKTSIARIFAAALNCQSTEDVKPCGFCRECTDIFSGKGINVREIDAADKKGIDMLRYLLRSMPSVSALSRYKIFVVDEFHLLSSKIWSAFIKYLEKPHPQIIFIFITADTVDLPRAFLTRCQKYLFPKIKEVDIVIRLCKICEEENLDVELDALNLIASNSDGSLCDAETMLDQLSLLGKKITSSLVYDLIGAVSDEKLLDLLEIAMSSDTAETVKKSRELMSSGVDPMTLMSQLAGLIMDIIAGTHRLASSGSGGSVNRSLTEDELGRLRQALNIVSDAEKQLRLSSERSTWFTAALLQLSSAHNLEPCQPSRSSNRSSEITISGTSNAAKESEHKDAVSRSREHKQICGPLGCSKIGKFPSDALLLDKHSAPKKLMGISHYDDANRKMEEWYAKQENLCEIWRQCIERCHSKALRELLSAYGKLDSVMMSEDAFIASISFGDDEITSRAERFLGGIINLMEVVLGNNVEVRISTKPASDIKGKSLCGSLAVEHDNGSKHNKRKAEPGYFERDRTEGATILSDSCVDRPPGLLLRSKKHHESSVEEACLQPADNLAILLGGNGAANAERYSKQEVSVQHSAKSVYNEQMLESAWLQSAERGTPGLIYQSRLEKNKVAPQNCNGLQNHNASSMVDVSMKPSEEELKNQMKALRINDSRAYIDENANGRTARIISPSLLHSNRVAANFDKDNLGYDSEPGCNGLLCWKSRKSHREKMKQGTRLKPQTPVHMSLFGQCGKSKTHVGNRFNG